MILPFLYNRQKLSKLKILGDFDAVRRIETATHSPITIKVVRRLCFGHTLLIKSAFGKLTMCGQKIGGE